MDQYREARNAVVARLIRDIEHPMEEAVHYVTNIADSLGRRVLPRGSVPTAHVLGLTPGKYCRVDHLA